MGVSRYPPDVWGRGASKKENTSMSDTVRKVEFPLGKETIRIETGALAKQANGAVLVTAGETVVLVTAVASATPKEGADFFPLTVDYRERTYAAGRIP